MNEMNIDNSNQSSEMLTLNECAAVPTERVARQSVREFYRGKKVFLTGGTGFLGKVLIEKLLMRLEVETIYILVREKNGKSIHTRIEKMTDAIYYDALRRKEPKFKHKLVPLNGDCAAAGLGLSIDDAHTLLEHVDVVLHCAATVRFNDRLDTAYAVNVVGTQGVVDLCRRMRRLAAFVHVSTAYSNCHVPHIEERFYEYALGAGEVAAALSKLAPDEIVAATPRIIRGWPNTYTFTKALGEQVVRADGGALPAAVFRPAIILSTYEGATPGWIDNVYGPVGASASFYAGLGRVVYVAQDDSCNVVPVDRVADGILAAAWEVGTRHSSTEAIKVYNYVSTSTSNSITWSEFVHLGAFYCWKYPLLSIKRTMSITVTHSASFYYLMVVMFHYLPAVLMDFLLLLSGNRPRMTHLYKKLHSQMAAVLFFVCHAWSFENNNVRQLYEALTLEDRLLLPLAVEGVNWKLFMRNYILGIRRYIFKEDDNTMEAARRKLKRIQCIVSVLKYAFYFLVLSYLHTNF